MRDILAEARTINVAGKLETFATYGELTARIDGYVTLLQGLESTLDDSHASNWGGLAMAAHILSELIEAAEAWLADDDTQREEEEEKIRREIRDLNL